VQRFKEKYLRRAFKNLPNEPHGLVKFIKENAWVERYAQFLVLKKLNKNKSWNKWRITEIPDDKKEEVAFHIWCQFLAVKGWNKLLKYANKKGIEIIADCPFYVDYNSADCYFNKEQFVLDQNYHPLIVSGCPPDDFSKKGQLWGTPVYNFEKMEANGFSFLINRLLFLAKRCNLLRLDHFRAFDTYYVIPAGDKKASRGQWLKGPGKMFFDRLYENNPTIKLIAEDLGFLFESVHELRDAYQLPGMRVMQFSIFEEALNDEHVVLYPGTHDNLTLYGWLKSLDKQRLNELKKKLGYPEDLYGALFNFIWNSKSLITIFPLQDLLRLDNRARINSPGTVGKPNWCFKLRDMAWQEKIKYGNR
ncbi:MAG: 4-alpha-glucanotransferase, partial [Erysipelotrichia bacterium]|nr:4-alpha-glucanotransferase [Erysipelotrichia bacterium]